MLSLMSIHVSWGLKTVNSLVIEPLPRGPRDLIQYKDVILPV